MLTCKGCCGVLGCMLTGLTGVPPHGTVRGYQRSRAGHSATPIYGTCLRETRLIQLSPAPPPSNLGTHRYSLSSLLYLHIANPHYARCRSPTPATNSECRYYCSRSPPGHGLTQFQRRPCDQRNYRSPIASLPIELLELVFLFLATEQVWYYGWYLAVAVDVVPLVCSRWRKLAKKRPRLWTTVLFHSYSNVDSLRRRLFSSGHHRIDVEIQQTHPGYGNTLSEYLEFAQMLATITPYIRTFRLFGFGGATTAEILRVFSETPAPYLEYVRVEATDDIIPPDSPWPLLFDGDMPRLRQATVIESVVSLGGFQDLGILCLLEQGHLDFRRFIRLLEGLQSLRRLYIRMKRYSEWDANTEMYEGSIALPRLQQLCIAGCQDNVLRILGPLEFAPNAYLRLTIFADNDALGRHRQLCSHVHAYTRGLRTVNLAYVNKVSRGSRLLTRSIAITSPNHRIRIKWVWSNAEDQSTQGHPGIFFDMVVDLQSVTKINITHLPNKFAVHCREWRRILELVPALEELELHVSTPAVGVVQRRRDPGAEVADYAISAHYASLCGALRDGDGQDHPLCPKLRLVASPHNWILLPEIVESHAACARSRLAAGASVPLLGYGEERLTLQT